LFRTGLGGAAPVEGAIDHRVHLVKPPAGAGCPAAGLRPALSAIPFQAKFHLCRIHAPKLQARVGQIRGHAEIPKGEI
jgi:hypothetical protein